MADKQFVTIANGGIDTRSVSFDDAHVPSAAEKAALAGLSGYTPSGDDPLITAQYFQDQKDQRDWQDSILHGLHYVKADTGAPSGTPATGEKCLNTFEKKLYVEAAGVWDAGTAISSGDRFCHAFTGTDTSGNSGTHTKSNKIYTYNGTAIGEVVPNDGFAALFEDEDKRRTYSQSVTSWVLFDSVSDHNSLSGKQGGTTDEYYHLTAAQAAAVAAGVLAEADLKRVPVPYRFTWRNGIGQSQTRTMFGKEGIAAYHLMPKACSIVSTTGVSSHARDAGICDFKLTIDGSPIVNANLNLQLNATKTNDAYGNEDIDVVTLTAGQKLGVQAISDAAWSTTDASDLESVEVEVMVVFENIIEE